MPPSSTTTTTTGPMKGSSTATPCPRSTNQGGKDRSRLELLHLSPAFPRRHTLGDRHRPTSTIPTGRPPGFRRSIVGFEKQLTTDISAAVTGYRQEGDGSNGRPTLVPRDQGQLHGAVAWRRHLHQGWDRPGHGQRRLHRQSPPRHPGNYFTHDRYNWTNYWGLELSSTSGSPTTGCSTSASTTRTTAGTWTKGGNNPRKLLLFRRCRLDPASYRSGLIFFNARWMVKANGLYKLPLGIQHQRHDRSQRGEPGLRRPKHRIWPDHYPFPRTRNTATCA